MSVQQKSVLPALLKVSTRILYTSPLRPIPLTLTVISVRQVRGVVQTVYHVETVDKASGEIVRLVLGEGSEVELAPLKRHSSLN